MRWPHQDSNTNAGERRPSLPLPATITQRWRRYVSDTLLAIVGVAFVTDVIVTGHLYPRILSIPFTYLLVIVALASTRGLYAAILAALLVNIAFNVFVAPSLNPFFFSMDDLLDPLVFLATTIFIG